MPTPPDRFLDTATRTFCDNAELQIIAHRELETMLDPSASDAAEEAAKRLDSVDHSSHPRLKPYLAGAVATISVLIAAWTAWGIYQDWDKLRWFDGSSSDDVAINWIRSLPPADQLILVGDPDASSREEGLKKLWKSDPENLLYFAEYSRESLKDLKTLLPGLRKRQPVSIPTMATFSSSKLTTPNSRQAWSQNHLRSQENAEIHRR